MIPCTVKRLSCPMRTESAFRNLYGEKPFLSRAKGKRFSESRLEGVSVS